MRVLIAVATADSALRAYIAANRNVVVPREIGTRGYLGDKGARFSIQMLAVSNMTSPSEIGIWLRRLANNADGLVLMIDDSLRHIAAEFEDAYFVASLPAYSGKVLLNQIRSAIAPVLRHFVSYCQRFDDLKNQKVLLLPLNIFIAAELDRLRMRLTADKMLPSLAVDIDRLIASLNQRARPKTKQSFRRVYFTDDRPLWYHYGKEIHCVVETTMPPHHEFCWHNSRFRFGRLYDDRLHYNIDNDSDPTCVNANFTNCHGLPFIAKGQSHLNVFPNGHI
jgi:hypothetical protein